MDVTGAAAIALVGGTGAALLVTAIGFELGRRRLRREVVVEHAAMVAGPVTEPDGRVAVGGTIASLDDETPATTRPFLLRLASGRVLRVEPGEAPRFRGELVSGGRLYVRGALRDGPDAAAPYRGAPWDGVIAAPPGILLELSTSELRGKHAIRADDAGLMVGLMLVLFAITQLLYVGFWVDVVRGATPSIILDLFFWAMLIDGSFILGGVISAWNARPWWPATDRTRRRTGGSASARRR